MLLCNMNMINIYHNFKKSQLFVPSKRTVYNWVMVVSTIFNFILFVQLVHDPICLIISLIQNRDFSISNIETRTTITFFCLMLVYFSNNSACQMASVWLSLLLEHLQTRYRINKAQICKTDHTLKIYIRDHYIIIPYQFLHNYPKLSPMVPPLK